jgi:hypothetical protein
MNASRCVAMLGVSTTILVAGASGVQAKGPILTEATIAGPGLDEPLRFEDRYGPKGRDAHEAAERTQLLAEQTLVYDVMYEDERVTSREPKGRLGPVFTITWTASWVSGVDGVMEEIGRFESHLYPYADGGPVMFTPRGGIGESRPVMIIGPAWSHASPALLENLHEWGLPTMEDLAPPPREAPIRTVAPPSRWSILVLMAAVLAATAAVAFRLRRRAA